jgi:hypothetical protein
MEGIKWSFHHVILLKLREISFLVKLIIASKEIQISKTIKKNRKRQMK